ncbi:MAG: protoporphyrinogen oxidase [Myxococcota bacterium]|nr:protoporphyrinogen oxidase [Myxococcota bacterium]
MKKIGIIGGGIAGLSIAEALCEFAPNLHPIVFESSEQAGGKIQTFTKEGFVIETGPHGFLDKEPRVDELIDRLGLRSEVVVANEDANNRYLVRNGTLKKLPLKPQGFLFSGILPLSQRLRVLFEPWVAANQSSEDESVYDFAARRLGPGVADVLIDAFVTGIFAGDPKKLSVQSAFPMLRTMERDYGSLIKAQKDMKARALTKPKLLSFKNGLGTLTQALAKKVEVRCQQAVQKIQKKGTRYLLHTADASEYVDAIVLAAPAHVSGKLTQSLNKRYAKQIASIPFVPVNVAVQCFHRQDIKRELDGFGFLVPHLEDRPVLGSIWASTVFTDHAPDATVMFRTLVGGKRLPENAEGSDEEILQRVRKQIEHFCGLSAQARPIVQEVIRWPRGIPQYEIGHSERVAAIDAFEREVPGLFFAGNSYRGVSMIQCISEAIDVSDKLQKFFAAE